MSDLLDLHQNKKHGPVVVFGKTFSSDKERREYFLEKLRAILKNPEFRSRTDFPNASDEEILRLSNPPYYTACPNPFIEDFVQSAKNANMAPASDKPYSGDLVANSRHPVYSFHPYHTKVPPAVIKTLIEHYTRPGDLVLDAFSGSGMTGVAAREAGRNAIVVDLSPIASFVSAINTQSNPGHAAAALVKTAIDESKKLLGWLYEVKEGRRTLVANYYVWTDVFTCPECVFEFPFFPHGVIHHGNKVETRKSFPCPSCSAELNVRRVERIITSNGKKKALAWVNAGAGRNRINRQPNEHDHEVVKRVADLEEKYWTPVDPIDPTGYSAKLAQLGDKGITDVSRFLSERNKIIFADLWQRISTHDDVEVRNTALSCLTSIFTVISERQGYFGGGGGMSGNLYMPIVRMEKNVYDSLERKLNKLLQSEAAKPSGTHNCIVGTQSATRLDQIPQNSIDYIYTDPPFGANIIYSEMNLILEGWLKVRTASTDEAVIDETKLKLFDDYGRLMRDAFKEYHRVLKPGHWITVEFHNTKASVWNLIQTSLSEAGFVVAQVGKLDKGSTTILADIRPGAVVQDLVISAYKPDGTIERAISERGSSAESAWQFVDQHLKHLPVYSSGDVGLAFIAERSERILYDRMVAWFIQHNTLVPLSAQEFFEGLRQRYAERDEMFFLADQIGDYDRVRTRYEERPQQELFVSDEKSAIDWLVSFLRKRPSTYREIHPEFVSQLGAGWRKHEERPELTDLLEDNFLVYQGNGDVPSQIHSYLSTNFKDLRGLEKDDPRLKAKAKDRWYVPDPSKAKDLEQKRERSLLKEFENYKSVPGRKLKEFRLEVLRAGFKTAWAAKDYKTIIGIAQKIPEEALQEDEKLLLWYDQALTRMEADA
ncbi:DNA methyltransferase [Ochrobactrum sp. MC-1LL]|uniref:DNA methyltransferase n=1 Tax=Ochrobactrum sp. MC-1LL TaxID=2735351 RepID=UPI0014382E85|nr:DNA methyltransferase [Ochrobactrum sp. MC-1LL]NKE76484.1 DNA modification methylase [Ochrobactrum sp. MC-1LL]